jgi:hypothetical protein
VWLGTVWRRKLQTLFLRVSAANLTSSEAELNAKLFALYVRLLALHYTTGVGILPSHEAASPIVWESRRLALAMLLKI